MCIAGLETPRTSGWRGNMGHILEGLFNHNENFVFKILRFLKLFQPRNFMMSF